MDRVRLGCGVDDLREFDALEVCDGELQGVVDAGGALVAVEDACAENADRDGDGDEEDSQTEHAAPEDLEPAASGVTLRRLSGVKLRGAADGSLAGLGRESQGGALPRQAFVHQIG